MKVEGIPEVEEKENIGATILHVAVGTSGRIEPERVAELTGIRTSS